MQVVQQFCNESMLYFQLYAKPISKTRQENKNNYCIYNILLKQVIQESNDLLQVELNYKISSMGLKKNLVTSKQKISQLSGK